MMKKLNRDEKFILGGEYYIFALIGTYTIMVGALIPFIRRDYGISYEMSGLLVSANSIGMIIMSLLASYTAALFGFKRAYLVQHALVIVGLVIIAVTGNPALLLIGMVFIGLSRGSNANYSNQIANDISKSDSRVMNLTGVFFAAGACAAPFIVLLFSDVTGNWRFANYAVSIAAISGILITSRMKLDNTGVKTGETKRAGFAFFKRRKFWIMFISQFCYSGIELSLIGWIATFFIETQNTTTEFASVMVTLIWVGELVGRIICSVIATRIRKARLILYLVIGMAVFMVPFVSAVNLVVLVVTTFFLGLFMSGVYSTVLADAGPIFSEFKYAFGYFLMMAGMGPVVTPAIIGFIAERRGVRAGVQFLAVMVFLLVAVSVLNVLFDNRENKQRIDGI